MNIERGVDKFANLIHETRKRSTAYFNRFPNLNDDRSADALLFALDDLQRQIDELKEERR